MAATLVGFGRYLNARRLICWSDEVIADPAEIKWLTYGSKARWTSQRNEGSPSATNQVDKCEVFAWRTLGVRLRANRGES
jgi:hypothetical protein